MTPDAFTFRFPELSSLEPAVSAVAESVHLLDRAQASLPGIDRILRTMDATRSARQPSLLAVLTYETSSRSPPQRRPEEMVMGCVDAFYEHADDPLRPEMAVRRAHRHMHANSVSNLEVRFAGTMRGEGGPEIPANTAICVRSEDVPLAMARWEDFVLNTGASLHPLVHAIVAHGMLKAISPFHSGNGEISRQVLPLSFRWTDGGYGSSSIGESFDRFDAVYEWAFAETLDRGDWTTFCRTVLDMIRDDAERNVRRLRIIYGMRRQWRAAVSGYRQDSMIHRLVDWAAVRPVFNSRSACSALRTSNHPYHLYAKALCDLGIATADAGHPRLVWIPGVIDLFDADFV